MRVLLVTVVFSGLSAAVCAQSANETVMDLESCFKLARGTASVCSDSANDPVDRVICHYKARRAELECLRQISPETSAGSVTPQTSAGTVRPELRLGTVLPEVTGTPEMPARVVDVPPKPRDTNWVVSETASPVDYAPLITAAIRLPPSVKDAPNILSIRCGGGRTELLVRTEGTWRTSRAREVRVDYQVNDQAPLRSSWTATADGKTATYKDDAAGLLQSLPEGARLKINVLDGPGLNHEATFQLAGLDTVRQKMTVACKWAPAANKIWSEQR